MCVFYTSHFFIIGGINLDFELSFTIQLIVIIVFIFNSIHLFLATFFSFDRTFLEFFYFIFQKSFICNQTIFYCLFVLLDHMKSNYQSREFNGRSKPHRTRIDWICMVILLFHFVVLPNFFTSGKIVSHWKLRRSFD